MFLEQHHLFGDTWSECATHDVILTSTINEQSMENAENGSTGAVAMRYVYFVAGPQVLFRQVHLFLHSTYDSHTSRMQRPVEVCRACLFDVDGVFYRGDHILKDCWHSCRSNFWYPLSQNDFPSWQPLAINNRILLIAKLTQGINVETKLLRCAVNNPVLPTQ